MTVAKRGSFHVLAKELAASAPMSWILARVLHVLDRFVSWLSGGKTTISILLTGLPVVFVTAIGARSGLPRTQPLVPIHDPAQPGRFALIASSFGRHHFPSWYFNLKKNPHAVVKASGRAEVYMAREASGDEYDRFWGYAVDAYAGYALYKQRAGRHIPILVLEKQ